MTFSLVEVANFKSSLFHSIVTYVIMEGNQKKLKKWQPIFLMNLTVWNLSLAQINVSRGKYSYQHLFGLFRKRSYCDRRILSNRYNYRFLYLVLVWYYYLQLVQKFLNCCHANWLSPQTNYNLKLIIWLLISRNFLRKRSAQPIYLVPMNECLLGHGCVHIISCSANMSMI